MLNSPQESQSRLGDQSLANLLIEDRLLTPLDQSFYPDLGKRLVPLTGFEFGTRDFTSAINLINYSLKLGLNKIDRKMLTLMLTKLSQQRRFGGDLHICPIRGEDPAAHSVHSAVLATEIFRRAGLLEQAEQDREVQVARTLITVGVLVHDMGEILSELSSLAQRVRNSNLTELPNIERDIFEIHLREAYRAAESLVPMESEFYSFHHSNKIKAAIGQGVVAESGISSILAVIQEYREKAPPLTENLERKVQRLLAIYDMAEIRGEGLGKDALFIGNAIKVIEHLQGTRHLIRFATRHPDDRRLNLFSIQQRESEVCGSWLPVTDQMLPIRYVSSYQISRMLNYNEAELHDLIRYASSEKQQRFARAAIMATYQTIAEYFSIARPVVEMSVQREDPQYVELQQRWDGSTDLKEKLVLMDAIKIYANNKLREDLNSARQERAKAQDGQTQYRFETKGRMINLYRWAADSGYLPISSTPLAKLNRG